MAPYEKVSDINRRSFHSVLKAKRINDQHGIMIIEFSNEKIAQSSRISVCYPKFSKQDLGKKKINGLWS